LQDLSADVIVIGGGMAGATLALALRSGGLKPILVERAPMSDQWEETFDGRASAIAFSAFRQWRTLGLGARLEPHAQRIEQILVTDGRSPGAAASKTPSPFSLRFDSAEIAERVDGEPLGYMLENRRIRVALAQGLAETDIEVLAPASLAQLQVEPGHATAILADGRRIDAPLVVAADRRAGWPASVRSAGRTDSPAWSPPSTWRRRTRAWPTSISCHPAHSPSCR
jgi:2-octaprenyl-6-methoxyphenol hydroxylase